MIEECNGIGDACVGVNSTVWTVEAGTCKNITVFNDAAFDAGDFPKFNSTAVNGSVTNFVVTTVWNE
jgi:hypothetical protein